MKEQFIENFKEALEIEDRNINMEDRFRDYDEWDSLAFLEVIAMIDEEYDVVIEGDDFKKLVTLNDVFEEIKKRKEETSHA